MPAIPFINDQGHIIIMADNKRVLVDTGSSFTIGEEECDIGGIHIVPNRKCLAMILLQWDKQRVLN